MSCDCKCSVALRNGAWVGLQCVLVAFPDNTQFKAFDNFILQHEEIQHTNAKKWERTHRKNLPT